MSDPTAAIDFVLRQEDSALSGVITNIAGDRGGTTRFGLTARYHPGLQVQGFYEPSMSAATALPLAIAAYQKDYATPLLLEEIDSQAIGTCLLSFAVNEEGAGSRGMAVRLLQQCLPSVTVDGAIGEITVAAINLEDESLLRRYCNLQAQHYRNIVQQDSSQSKFLAGWLNRVNQNASL